MASSWANGGSPVGAGEDTQEIFEWMHVDFQLQFQPLNDASQALGRSLTLIKKENNMPFPMSASSLTTSHAAPHGMLNRIKYVLAF